MTVINAFTDDALGVKDAVGVAEAIAAGEVSRGEVLGATIARCETVDQHLNAIAFKAYEGQHLSIAGASSGGFFSGVPTFIKDMVQVAGMPTTQGADAWDPRPATQDGAFVEQFRSLGVIPLGMTRISEFAFSAAAEHPRLGPVRNPWNTDFTPGGSSSGAAALVASGAVPFAHAVDGGGSIRIPASCTGLIGLKPSRGRLPLDTTLRRIPIRIACNGILTRTVRDTSAFYREMEKHCPAPSLRPIGDVTGPDNRRLRVAVATKSVLTDCTPEVRDETLRVAAVLEHLGHYVEPIDVVPVPDSFAEDFFAYYSLAAFVLVRQGRRRFGPSFDSSKLDALTHGLARRGAASLTRTPAVLARLSMAGRFSQRFYQRYDVLLSPTLAKAPLPVGELDPMNDFETQSTRLTSWAAYTPFQNVAGEPSLSLPTGQSAAGTPIGTLLSAAKGHEARLLHLAYELGETQPWRTVGTCP
ncbi:amidase [Mycobacterium sp. BMJ-28]